MKIIFSKAKEEKGNFTILTLATVLVIIVFAGLFINLTMTYLNINFSKKALEEATRTRALAVDIVMKENYGVIETITDPHVENDFSHLRQAVDFIGNPISGTDTAKYKDSVLYAENSARQSMVASVDSFIGNSVSEGKIIDMKNENICFDIKPLEANETTVNFSCAAKSPDGKVYTVQASIPVMGYEDLTQINNFEDKTTSNGVDKDNGVVRVSNVVFGAAIIAPKSLITNGLKDLGFQDKPETVIYSVAYPQIDSCYGGFC